MHPNAVVHKMPSSVPAAHAAAFLPFSNGVEWAYRYGEIGLGKSILIQGPGQQGLACVIAAREAGAACIIVSGLGRDTRRLEIARKLGAHATVNIEAEDLIQRVRDETGGAGADVVVNVSGGRGAVAQGIAVAAKRSTVVLAAPGSEEISVGSIGRRNLTLKWAHGHSYASVELAIQMIASGKYPSTRSARIRSIWNTCPTRSRRSRAKARQARYTSALFPSLASHEFCLAGRARAQVCPA
jgi:threonine dehydrogenase-like Zn-dependent dehydrogenase